MIILIFLTKACIIIIVNVSWSSLMDSAYFKLFGLLYTLKGNFGSKTKEAISPCSSFLLVSSYVFALHCSFVFCLARTLQFHVLKVQSSTEGKTRVRVDRKRYRIPCTPAFCALLYETQSCDNTLKSFARWSFGHPPHFFPSLSVHLSDAIFLSKLFPPRIPMIPQTIIIATITSTANLLVSAAISKSTASLGNTLVSTSISSRGHTTPKYFHIPRKITWNFKKN